MTKGVSDEVKPSIPDQDEEVAAPAADATPHILDSIFEERDSKELVDSRTRGRSRSRGRKGKKGKGKGKRGKRGKWHNAAEDEENEEAEEPQDEEEEVADEEVPEEEAVDEEEEAEVEAPHPPPFPPGKGKGKIAMGKAGIKGTVIPKAPIRPPGIAPRPPMGIIRPKAKVDACDL